MRKRKGLVQRMDALTAPTNRDALRVAALAGDAGITASQLAAELKATRAQMLNILDGLEKQGFVKGTPSRENRKPGVATQFRIQPHRVEAALRELELWILAKDVLATPLGTHVAQDEDQQ